MYDLMIIGAGPGGYEAAIRAAQNGMNVILFEKRALGGTCLNVGCVPTKALLHGSSLYAQMERAEAWGITATASLDAGRLYARKDEIVGTLRGGVEQLLKQNKVSVVMAEAQILGKGRVRAAGEDHEGRAILIATGSRPVMPPIPGLDLPGVIDSDDIIENPFEGEHLAILGGGVIGTEIASICLSMGKKVTIIEALERVLPQMDREISQTVSMQMKAQADTGRQEAHRSQEGEDGLLPSEGQGGGDPLRQPASLRGPARLHRGSVRRGSGQARHGARADLTDREARTSGRALRHRGRDQRHTAGPLLAQAWPWRTAGRQADRRRPDLVPSCVYTEPEIASVGLMSSRPGPGDRQVSDGRQPHHDRRRRPLCQVAVLAEDERLLAPADVRTGKRPDRQLHHGHRQPHDLTDMLRGMLRITSSGVQEALESVHGRAIHVAPPGGRRSQRRKRAADRGSRSLCGEPWLQDILVLTGRRLRHLGLLVLILSAGLPSTA